MAAVRLLDRCANGQERNVQMCNCWSRGTALTRMVVAAPTMRLFETFMVSGKKKRKPRCR